MASFSQVKLDYLEVSTHQGDLIGLFIYDHPPNDHINDAACFIRDKGAVTYLPHPGIRLDIDQVDLSLIDVVEIFNSRANEKANLFARDYFHDHNITGVCGSDTHLI